MHREPNFLKKIQQRRRWSVNCAIAQLQEKNIFCTLFILDLVKRKINTRLQTLLLMSQTENSTKRVCTPLPWRRKRTLGEVQPEPGKIGLGRKRLLKDPHWGGRLNSNERFFFGGAKACQKMGFGGKCCFARLAVF